jgi:hypothetical protein
MALHSIWCDPDHPFDPKGLMRGDIVYVIHRSRADGKYSEFDDLKLLPLVFDRLTQEDTVYADKFILHFENYHELAWFTNAAKGSHRVVWMTTNLTEMAIFVNQYRLDMFANERKEFAKYLERFYYLSKVMGEPILPVENYIHPHMK